MVEIDGRRSRPIISCALCRRRKIKCDRGSPCNNCIRARNPHCVYKTQRKSTSSAEPGTDDSLFESISNSSNAKEKTTANLTPPSSHTSPKDLTTQPQPSSHRNGRDQNPQDISELESRLTTSTLESKGKWSGRNDDSTTMSSSLFAGTFHVFSDHVEDNLSQAIPRSMAHKTRVFGQSHWAVSSVGLILDMFSHIEGKLVGETAGVIAGTQRCKQLARSIKARRAPAWPTIPTVDLPAKELCDVLVKGYLTISESVFRILHIPTFEKEYEALWQPGAKRTLDSVMQLKAILAIGSIVYDEAFTLRISATSWICEVRCWLQEPRFKSRLAIQGLQTHVLLLMASEMVGIGAEPAWITAGALIRRAMHMGLHRDPSRLPKMPLVVAETRRRLWTSIMEINLLASLTVGCLSQLELDDFDVAAPSNYDDDQLLDDNAVPKPDDQFTQSTIMLALQKSFVQRARIVKSLNHITPMMSYEAALNLDSQLRAAHKSAVQLLYPASTLADGQRPHTGIQLVDFIIMRYFSALHSPYYAAALKQTKYAYSRKIVVDMSMKIVASISETAAPGDSTSSSRSELARMTNNSSGYVQTIGMHAFTILMLELKAQIEENKDFGSSFIRPDLLSITESAQDWCLKTLQAGDTNVRAVQLVSMIVAHVEAVQRSLNPDETTELVMERLLSAIQQCEPILQQQLNELNTGSKAGSVAGSGLTSPLDSLDDWALFDQTGTDMNGADSMNWMFADDFDTGMSFL